MSRIFKTIKKLVQDGTLVREFSVQDVRRVSPILDRSPAFLSKHAVVNPKNYTPYFVRVREGYYKINPVKI
ncbi:MAG: hypothetical protein K8F30_07160 [Taibaiella sp.]|nr:hypothetical protein [Taibaiella sp.]